jgi:hypothetical protein
MKRTKQQDDKHFKPYARFKLTPSQRKLVAPISRRLKRDHGNGAILGQYFDAANEAWLHYIPYKAALIINDAIREAKKVTYGEKKMPAI